MELIEYRNVSVQYEQNKPVLRNVNIALEKGSITAFLGPNGSGKTTLMSALNKLVAPFEGEILVGGDNIHSITYKKLAGMIATVPQFAAPAFSFTVHSMILLGRAPHISYMPKRSDYEIVDEVLDRFDISHLKDKPFTRISGGERQLVLVARAIAQRTPIVLMDEPTTYLDIKNQIRILNVIKELNKTDGVTFVLTLHDPNHALYLADTVVIVNTCEAIQGNAAELLTEENVLKHYQVKASFQEMHDMRYMTIDYRDD